MDFPTLATLFSGVSFLFFGTTCLTTTYMREEFDRYGLGRQRVLTGILQLLGGTGLLLGYFLPSPLIALSAAVGLGLLMAAGFGVRMKIGDSWLLAAPAFLYAALNFYLGAHYAGWV